MKHILTLESFFGLFKSKAEKDNETISIDELSYDVIEGAFMDAIDIADDYDIDNRIISSTLGMVHVKCKKISFKSFKSI